MRQHGVTRRWVPDALGAGWTVLAVVAVMAPVLRPGVSLGSFDLLSRIGLTQHAGHAVHSQFPADQVLYFLPFTNLAWHQVHQGHLPLWNPYNLLGTPLAFNWQPGVFSVPVLLSYLAPVRYAYSVIVLVKLLVAGTGAYTLCRVLRMGPLSAAFGGTAFELSGPMLHYSGWAMTSVTCWAGWIFAAAILLVRGRHRLRDTIALALAVAAAVYGGHPESVAVLGASLVIFLAVYLGLPAWRAGTALRRPIVDLVVAGAAGLGLSAPLVLPGLQVVQASGRAAASGGAAFGLSHLSDLLIGLQGTDFRVPSPYVGILVAVLAVVAVRVRWRAPEIMGLAAVVVVALFLSFQNPLSAVVQGAPGLGQITWNRDVMLLALGVAVLGAAGLEALVRGTAPAVVRRWALRSLGAAGVVVAVVALAVAAGVQHTMGGVRALLAGAAAAVVVGVVVVRISGVGTPSAPGAAADRLRRRSAAALVVLQSALLVAAGVSFWSISSTYFSPTPAVSALQRTVGSSALGIGSCRPRPFSKPFSTEVGIRPDVNVAFAVHEFAIYEPVLAAAYYRSWLAVSGEHVARSLRRVGLFCPQITTAAEARVYGVPYVLVAPGTGAPSGAVRDGSVGGERLFRVSGAAAATVNPAPPTGQSLPLGARGTPVTVSHPDDASWRVVVSADEAQVLRLRLTAEPGWHATIDGHPLALQRWAAGLMLEARVPPGRHVIALQYWPTLFTTGIVVAGVVVVAGAATVALQAMRRARRGTDVPLRSAGARTARCRSTAPGAGDVGGRRRPRG